MRLAILADTHFGARNDSPFFDQSFREFFTNVFFPYLDEHNIKTVIHLGDIFDRRKFINFQILSSCKQYFFDELVKRNITMFAVIGNHDTHYKNTNNVNSPELLLREYKNVKIFSDPTTHMIDGVNFNFVPWVCDDNVQSVLEFIKNTRGICFGHFELDGFTMSRGIKHTGGMSRDVLKNYTAVFTGHFHHKSAEGNIFYLGSPYQFTWTDYQDVRGFHVLETDDMSLDFVKNPNQMFHKIYYKDSAAATIDVPKYERKCIKLIVEEKKDFHKYEMLLNKFYDMETVEFIIHDDFVDFDRTVVDGEVNVEDTMTLLGTFIDSTDTSLDKQKLKELLKVVYVEAQDVEL